MRLGVRLGVEVIKLNSDNYRNENKSLIPTTRE
jgi:hypothetical protein